jgi:hypothetical protein
MKRLYLIVGALFLLNVTFALQACMAGERLLPVPANPATVKGTYTVILYGCRYPDDIENMAILVDEKSPYPLEVYAMESLYKVKKNVPAAQALSEAKTFVNCSMHTVWQTVLRRIPDDTGKKTIGYELKPLFQPWESKVPEVLLSSYSLKDGKVTTFITLDPSVNKHDGLRDRKKRPGNL